MKNEKRYYDGTKLLSLKDKNGKKPEIFICTSNRSAGKTTFFSRLCVKRFLENKGKFCLIYRFRYELDEIADKFFKDIQELFFPEYHMYTENIGSGIIVELFLTKDSECSKGSGKSCGYAIALNSADQIKKYSHLLSDVERFLFDEFQSETNHYCPKEVDRFISVHRSVARGHGEQSRYVPVYMVGNPVTLLNPYYVSMGISAILRKDTKFLKGDGFVLEQGYVESAAKAQSDSAFIRAFSNMKYAQYSSEALYLNDSDNFVEKMKGKSIYLCTLKYHDKHYAIREFQEEGVIYCDDKADMLNKNKIAVTTEDHSVNYVMLKRNELFLANLRYYFERGCFRFKDLSCKEAILTALSY